MYIILAAQPVIVFPTRMWTRRRNPQAIHMEVVCTSSVEHIGALKVTGSHDEIVPVAGKALSCLIISLFHRNSVWSLSFISVISTTNIVLITISVINDHCDEMTMTMTSIITILQAHYHHISNPQWHPWIQVSRVCRVEANPRPSVGCPWVTYPLI